jgi:hypothetical protein
MDGLAGDGFDQHNGCRSGGAREYAPATELFFIVGGHGLFYFRTSFTVVWYKELPGGHDYFG